LNFSERCSIISGTASSGGELSVIVMNDKLAEERRQHSIPLSARDRVWSPIPSEPVLPWITAGLASVELPSTQIVIVGWGGQVLVMEGGSTRREGIQRSDSQAVSIIRTATQIGGLVYTAGMRRQVHVRRGNDSWVEIDRGVAYQGERFDLGFNAIGGLDRNEVYAAGMNGEIWEHDGSRWEEIQSPTNVHLHCICCSSDGTVFAGGRSGVLLRGRHDSWQSLDLDIEDTIWDVCWFVGKLYLITREGVFTHSEGKLEKVQSDAVAYSEFLKFSCANGKLWLFGQKRVAQFDGSTWDQYGSTISDAATMSPAFPFFNDDVLSQGSDYLED